MPSTLKDGHQQAVAVESNPASRGTYAVIGEYSQDREDSAKIERNRGGIEIANIERFPIKKCISAITGRSEEYFK